MEEKPDLYGVAAEEAVRVTNGAGAGTYVLTCDHASNFIPRSFGTLGLSKDELERHIAWDPGALAVAKLMAEALDRLWSRPASRASCLTATARSMRLIWCRRSAKRHQFREMRTSRLVNWRNGSTGAGVRSTTQSIP